MKFGSVLQGLEKGKRYTREGWNGKGVFIELQVPDKNSKMKRPYIFITPIDERLVPWTASQTDLLADDWVRVK